MAKHCICHNGNDVSIFKSRNKMITLSVLYPE